MKKLAFMLAFLFLGSAGLFAQMTISGKVTDSEGKPIPGVSIWAINNISIGTLSNENGDYEISITENVTALGFSFMGFETSEIAINGQTTINVTLKTIDFVFDDVVVTALGIERSKKALGYAIQEVTGDELTKAKESNIVNSLTGKIAGVQVMGTNNIGGSSRILIRGANTIASNNQPLFVIDGMPVDNSNYGSATQAMGGGAASLSSSRDYGNAAQDINPDDIESISVLKGANAAALYGSRGANGVIIITTKKGKKGQGFGVSFSSGVNFTQAFDFPDLQNKYGGGSSTTFTNDTNGIPSQSLSTDESWGPVMEGQLVKQWGGENNIGIVRPWEAHPDNYKDYFELGVTYDNNLAISGSTDNTTYRLSYTLSDQTGVVPNSSLTRNTLNLSLDRKITNKLTVGGNISYIKNSGKGKPSTGGTSDNIPYNLTVWSQRQLDLADFVDYKYPDGKQRTWRTNSFGVITPQSNNPYWLAYEDYQDDERNRIIGNVNFTYDILDGLKLTGRLGQDWYHDRRMDRRAVGSRYTPFYMSDQIEFSEINGDLILNYNKQLNEDISISANVGGSFYQLVSRRNSQQTSGGLSVPGVYSVSNSVDRPLIRDTYSKKVVQGLFASASFGYKNFAYLDGAIRNDWSSTLPAPHSYFYPSISGSFIFSELLGLDFLSFGKARLGWAKAGNDTSPYQLDQSFNIGTPVGSNPIFTNSTTLGNANLKPEITVSKELGLELMFFKNRIGFNGTFYKSNTYDQIFAINVSRTTGYATKLVNAGEVENKGIELSLNAGILKTKNNLTWDLTVNWSKNKNKVVELIEGVSSYVMTSLYASGTTAVYLESRVGEEFSTIYASVIKKNDAGQNLISSTGYYQVEPVLKNMGSVLPDWNLGVNNSFGFKGFSLSALLDFQKGGVIFSRTYQEQLYAGTAAETAEGTIREDGVILDGVKDDGSVNTTVLSTQLYFKELRKTPGNHTIFDASYLKLREITFGYNLPSSLLGKTPIKKMNLSLVGRNLAILYRNTPAGVDPESGGNSSSNIQGRDYGNLPAVRNVGFKLTLEL